MDEEKKEEAFIMPYSDEPRRKPADTNQLLQSVTSLTKSMDSLLQLFRTAVDELKLEEKEEQTLASQVQPIIEKLDEILEQNKVIAEGMVALSDLVKQRFLEKPRMPPSAFPPPPMPPRQFMPPPEPTPPPLPPKRGFFGR